MSTSRGALRQKIQAKRDMRTGASHRAAQAAMNEMGPNGLADAMGALGISADAMRKVERAVASGGDVKQLTEMLCRESSVAGAATPANASSDEEAAPPNATEESSDEEAPPPLAPLSSGCSEPSNDDAPSPSAYVPRCERQSQKSTRRKKAGKKCKKRSSRR